MSTTEIVILLIGVVIWAPIVYGGYSSSKKKDEKKKRAEEAAKQRAKENLAGKRVVVVLRKKDGRSTMLETLLIRNLTEYGATVVSIPQKTADEIASGKRELIPENLVGFIGAAWVTDKIHNLDVRVMRQDGEILTGAYACCDSPERLAELIAREIGSTLKGLAEIEAARS